MHQGLAGIPGVNPSKEMSPNPLLLIERYRSELKRMDIICSDDNSKTHDSEGFEVGVFM
jgi:hypothetical protein